MSLDIAKLREETPGCREVLHFDNAGAALMPQAVIDAQVEHIGLEAKLGGYSAADRARPAIERTYDAIAEMLNCGRDEIALTENATAAWNQAFHAFRFKPGDRILTAEAEYASNYITYLKAARDQGVVVEPVPSDASGQLSVPALESMVDEEVKLISISHVPTNGGLVNPAAAIGRVARGAGIPFLLDACQSVGQMPLDVEAIGCDLLTAAGRKYLRGPRGSGFLYVRKSLLDQLDPPVLDLLSAKWEAPDRYALRPDARRFENWEFNCAAVIGLGVAVDYACDLGLEAIETRVQWLARRLRSILSEDMKLPVYDLGETKCGIVTFTLPDRDAATMQATLRRKNVNVSISSPASTRLDAEKRGLPELIRASLHYYNTEEEIDRFCYALREP
ncbi:MAG: aminotransferase class V-fold PLP-dependent enzyme [Kiloniellales bacterium]|nr:aminotransferase class V-fold PLP-dependent enzyme [Kiloniellales bacterium]